MLACEARSLFNTEIVSADIIDHYPQVAHHVRLYNMVPSPAQPTPQARHLSIVRRQHFANNAIRPAAPAVSRAL
jgi:hypothetical protein